MRRIVEYGLTVTPSLTVGLLPRASLLTAYCLLLTAYCSLILNLPHSFSVAAAFEVCAKPGPHDARNLFRRRSSSTDR